MSNNLLDTTLAAALPRRAAQSGADLPSYPELLAIATIAPGAPDRVSTGSTLLETTLKQVAETISQSNTQLSELRVLQQQLLQSTNQNTQALNTNTQTRASSGSTLASAAGNIAGEMFGGSILAPIISGLVSLFGSGVSSRPVYTPFTMPAPVQIQTTLSSTPPAAAATSGQTAAASMPAATFASFPNVQVQVNAIDSRSFLDHSDAIADAVRRALLSAHSLGDVIASL